ncbi:RNA 2',3'-cyclic phosphodiesterase [Thermosulfurimonas dismutans]|uniref:RNA 2',3'-cyclic phosphodiesterase n=1 Tax=Thermosulfurimonas dismutans TaxID=999894 RepID=A0A179D703_9BACT|nr:RNA 2',3'-cyclic phosphodiesterase [Thermosulfurimonas dismutans]OAQ21870.1 2'-5' RNA ligase [Thermosulfurimonas dismutans]
MIRCFLAIALPERIKEILAGLQKELKTIGANVRWVRPDGFHLTLKFFGNIPEEKLPALVRATEKAKDDFNPFELSLSGLGFFPEKGPPRVIWVGLSGELEPLLALQRRLEKAFKKVGFPPEKRPFHPHLTLGRVKESRGTGKLKELAGKLKIPAESFRVERLTFYRSVLHPEGAVYSVLEEVEL